jgi:hypothetical protein
MAGSNKKRGGGWSLDPSKMVSVGNLENMAYTGAGKDCMSNSFVRPGFISGHSGSGMPGMSGGKRRGSKHRGSKHRGSKRRGGALLLGSPFTSAPGVSAPGIPLHPQKGGRYESNPGALLDGGSDMGMKSYSMAASIGCERGTTNSLNMGTGSTMRGGAQLMGAPTVSVGAADSMRYNAPTAGYGHGFQTFPGASAVGGLMLNTPYDARGYNPACSKTGGGVADGAAPYSSLQASQMTGRGDFDGSKGALPMKYGGSRRRSKHRKQRKQRKHHTRRHSRT